MRGFNNITGEVVIDSSVENAVCYLRLKEAYQASGRLEICGCGHECEAKRRIFQYIGLTIDMVVVLHENGFTMTVQQLTGSKIFDTFFSKYCTTELINEVLCYKFIKKQLPFQAFNGRSAYEIFARNNIPVKMVKRSKKMI